MSKDDYLFQSPAQRYLRLLNAELRARLIAEGKWPAPPGWSLTLADIGLEEVPEIGDDGERIAARLERALERSSA